ncbi:MAG TPA: hypothetical protein VH583_01975 [Vicinamibacterales bacterium]|jgi:hypothetical protein
MKSVILASSLLVMTAGLAFGQSPTGYNKANETTLSGPIRYVLAAASPDGTVGVHLELKTPAGLVRVSLGPALFIASNNYYFFADEQVYVVGAKAATGEIWARTISKDGKTFLTLRDEDGTPRWQRATDDDPDGCGVSHAPIR